MIDYGSGERFPGRTEREGRSAAPAWRGRGSGSLVPLKSYSSLKVTLRPGGALKRPETAWGGSDGEKSE
jgi:hypothetical protein